MNKDAYARYCQSYSKEEAKHRALSDEVAELLRLEIGVAGFTSYKEFGAKVASGFGIAASSAAKYVGECINHSTLRFIGWKGPDCTEGKRLKIMLRELHVSPDSELIETVQELCPDFGYGPQSYEKQTGEPKNIAQKIESLRPEHRESLERLANTYLSRYEEEQRADYQGAD